MEWVASTLTPPPNVVYPALLKLMHTPRLQAVDWTDAPTDLNGLVRFGKRRILVSTHVPSRSARAILSSPKFTLHSPQQRYRPVWHSVTAVLAAPFHIPIWPLTRCRSACPQTCRGELLPSCVGNTARCHSHTAGRVFRLQSVAGTKFYMGVKLGLSNLRCPEMKVVILD